MKKASKTILNLLNDAKNKGGTITYHFHGGRQQSQPINEEVFKDYKGKDTSLANVVTLFNDTQQDLGAKYYIITTNKH